MSPFANTDIRTAYWLAGRRVVLRDLVCAAMEGASEPVAAPPADPLPELRESPPPRGGGLMSLLRFMRRKGMLNAKYLRLVLRLGLWKFRLGRRLRLDGLAFVGPRCQLEVGPNAVLELGRWSWIGHGCKIRCHEGAVSIGAKTVMGQECTISAFQHVSIGRECVIADRAMLIDFDHGMVDVERPIRLQGIYKRDVRVGNNVWIGYGACVLRGASIGDNAVVGTNAVVTRSVAANAVVGGVPARLIRMREAPQRMSFE
jgi:acetyltransferase-like isoleucine patch superfamily enzyme